MATKIQVRRGTASEWTTSNPVLSEGELGFETNTGKFKIGDGSGNWSALAYAGGSETLEGVDNVYTSNLSEGDYLYYREQTFEAASTASLGNNLLVLGGYGTSSALNGTQVSVIISDDVTDIEHSFNEFANSWTFVLPPTGYTYLSLSNYINNEGLPFPFFADFGAEQLPTEDLTTVFANGQDGREAGWYNKPLDLELNILQASFFFRGEA